MNGQDRALRDAVKRAWPENDAPAFEKTWAAAGRRASGGHRRLAWLATAAAIGAVAVIAFNKEAPQQTSYIEMAELLESTYWRAPSDALLPDRQFDIYQDMPEIFESTETAGGSLL